MRIKDQRGGALVEFAIIMPLLFVLLFGIIDFSIMLYDKAMLTNASREGARKGIVFSDPRPTDGDIIGVVDAYCGSHLISFQPGSTTTSTVVDRVGGTVSGASLSVTVTYQYQWLVISKLVNLFGGSLQEPIPLTAVTVMRLE